MILVLSTKYFNFISITQHMICFIRIISNHSYLLQIPGIMHLIYHIKIILLWYYAPNTTMQYSFLRTHILYSHDCKSFTISLNSWYYAPNLSPQWFFLLVLRTKYYNSIFYSQDTYPVFSCLQIIHNFSEFLVLCT